MNVDPCDVLDLMERCHERGWYLVIRPEGDYDIYDNEPTLPADERQFMATGQL